MKDEKQGPEESILREHGTCSQQQATEWTRRCGDGAEKVLRRELEQPWAGSLRTLT